MYNKTLMRSACKQSTFQRKCTDRSIEIRQQSHSTLKQFIIYTRWILSSMIHQCLEGGYLCILMKRPRGKMLLLFLDTLTHVMLCCCFLTALDGHPLQPLCVESIKIQPGKLLEINKQFFSHSHNKEFLT